MYYFKEEPHISNKGSRPGVGGTEVRQSITNVGATNAGASVGAPGNCCWRGIFSRP